MKWTRACVTVVTFFATASVALAQRSTPVQLLHPAGAAGDQFGRCVAIDGNTMIVGAPFDDVGANAEQGSAQIYRRSGTGWIFEATLTAADGAALDRFGISVAIAGSTAIVGAYLDNLGANGDQGSAYIFTRSGTTWTQQAQLTAADGAANDLFGGSVALSAAGDRAIVGAYLDNVGANGDQGSAYIFTRSGTAWAQEDQLIASDGAAGDGFGISVALAGAGDTALIGAQWDNVGANGDQGSAYLFTRAAGGDWTQETQFIAFDGGAGDLFGVSVALGMGAAAGDTAVVGAYLDNVGSNNDQGSVYTFTRVSPGGAWSQNKFTAADGAANDLFGGSVALGGIEGAYDTLIVGAYNDSVGPNNQQGSAYVFTRPGTIWTQQARLTAPDAAPTNQFGYAVALSGNTAVIGSIGDDLGSDNEGSAWVVTRVGSTWIGPDHKILGAPGLAGDNFANSIAISGDLMIVGAPLDDIGANADQGSAYIFTRLGPGSPWLQETQLLAADGAAGDQFGLSVAVSGDTAVVGTPFANVGPNAYAGTAYVFIRSGTTWSLQQKLTAVADAAALDALGISVAISGNTLIVGAWGDDVGANTNQGSAYVFTRSGSVWSLQQKLTATDGAPTDAFGYSVTLEGDTAVVGAIYADTPSPDRGAAYVFVRSGTTWTQQQKLFAPDGGVNDYFGYAVSISADTAVVSAYADDIGANTDRGSVYVFTRSGTVWLFRQKLTAADGASSDYFGSAVAVSGNTLAVGAYGDTVGTTAAQGSAYVFARLGVAWAQAEKLTAPDGGVSDRFGNAAAISPDTVVVGSFADDVGANTDQGSAYAFGVVYNDLSLVRSQTVTVARLGTLTGEFNEGSGIRRLSDGATLTFATNGVESSFDSAATQAVAAGGGQTGGGFVDGGLRVAETSQAVVVSYGSTPSGATVIDVQESTRAFLATGYSVIDFCSATVTLDDPNRPRLDIGGTGPMQFATYYSGTPNMFQGSLTAVSGGASISGNTLTPGQYAIGATPPCCASLSSASPPGDLVKEALFRIVILKRCIGDFNNSGAATTQDLFDFLAAYFGGDPRADVNAVGGLSVQDIFDFLAAFFTPCT